MESTIAGGCDHADGSADLQAEPARIGHLDGLDAQHAHDLAASKRFVIGNYGRKRF